MRRAHPRWALALAVLAAGIGLPVVAPTSAMATPTCSGSVAAGSTYTCTPSGGGYVQVTVPAGVASITVVADGGGGGKNAGLGNGGSGARVTASIPVTAGKVLKVYVGAGGGAGLGGSGNVGGTGYGAGGNGGPYYGEGFGGGYGGGGGGSSAVLVGSDDTVIAGGGGGGGAYYGGSASAVAGGSGGGGGVAGNGSPCAVGGGGGNAAGSGSAGTTSGAGNPTASSAGLAGKGGGGIYGAGGASSGGGGGGGGYGGGGAGNWNGPYGCVNAGGGGAGGSFSSVAATFGSAGNAGLSGAGGDGEVAITFVPAPATAPGAPTSLVFSGVTTSAMTLYWTPPASDGGSALLGYDVVVDSAPPVRVTDPTYALTGLNSSQTYNLSITAVNAIGASTALTGSQMTDAPGAPTGPATGITFPDRTSTTITVSWTAPAPVPSWPTLGYQVRVNGGPLTWSPTTTYVAGGLMPATHYTFDVYVVNGAGTSTAATGDDTTYATVPGAPTNLVFTAADDTSITATWTAPASNGGAAILNYFVSVDGGASVSVPSTTYTATGLASSTWHTFSITAFNNQGSSQPLTGSRSTTAPPNSPMITASATTVGSASTVTLTGFPASTDETVVVTAPDGSDSNLFVTVNGSGSGTASYTPSQAGTYGLVTDPYPRSATFVASAVPGPGPGPGPGPTPATPSMTPTSQTLEGVVGTPVTATTAFTLSNVTGTPTFTVSPALPDGLSIDSSTGVVSGTPTVAHATASHVITATAGSQVVTSTLQVTVGAAPVISIVVTGSRDGANPKLVKVAGAAPGLAGQLATPYIRFRGQPSYTAGFARPLIDAEGTFTWERNTPRKLYVYFTAAGIVSNRLIFPAASLPRSPSAYGR